MNWINPKIDWKTGATPGPGDFNRIEGNILIPRMQIFLASGFFIVLDGIAEYWVSICGGGGGGANYSNGNYAGGGSAEAVYRKKITVIPGESIPIAVGKGGAAAAAGGASSFGTYLSCAGGGRAQTDTPGSAGGPGGEPGTSGQGGSGLFGMGAHYLSNASYRSVAGGYGSGGCSAASLYCNGTDGIVIVEW